MDTVGVYYTGNRTGICTILLKLAEEVVNCMGTQDTL
jgi:hypothetical protein